MIEGRPSVDNLVRLTVGGRDCVTIYQPILPAEVVPAPKPYLAHRRLHNELDAAMTTAVNRLVGRGAGHDTHWAVRQRFAQLTRDASFEGQAVALFLSAESATGFALPDRIEASVRVGDHFDLGPLLRAVTMARHVYGVTLTEHDWGLWEATGGEPARRLAGESRDDAFSALDPRVAAFKLYRLVTDSPAYFLARSAFLERAMQRVRELLAALDAAGSGLVVLFPDDDIVSGLSPGRLTEDARLGRPIEVVHGDSEALTPGRIGQTLRRHGRRFVQQELSGRIARLRAEHAEGYPSTDLPEIAVAAAAGRVRTFVYDSTAARYGAVDRGTGRFEPDQWGYDMLARIAIDVLAGGGEAYAVTPDEILTGAMDTPVLAEIAYPTLR